MTFIHSLLNIAQSFYFELRRPKIQKRMGTIMSERVYLCERCNRPLKSAASREIGYGPACARYLGIIPSRFRGNIKTENSSFAVGMVRGKLAPFCLAYYTGGNKKEALIKHPAFLGDRLAYYFDVRELWDDGKKSHVKTLMLDKDNEFYEVKLYQQKDLFGGFQWVAEIQNTMASSAELMQAARAYLDELKI